MIGDHQSLVSVLVEDFEHPLNVQVPFVDERLVVVWHLAAEEMDVLTAPNLV